MRNEEWWFKSFGSVLIQWRRQRIQRLTFPFIKEIRQDVKINSSFLIHPPVQFQYNDLRGAHFPHIPVTMLSFVLCPAI